MSDKKQPKVKLVSAIAVHDLSYIDHEGTPQYRRQNSRDSFEIDQDNFDFFAGRNAIRLAKPEAEAAPVEDEVEDDFADKTPGDKGDEKKSNTLSLSKDAKK